MLYISRRVWYKPDDPFSNPLAIDRGICKYGVVDSDDNVETLVTFEQLCSLVGKPGIKIHGVDVERDWDVSQVSPYQYKPSVACSKAKVIKRIEVTTWNNWVTALDWRRQDIHQPVSLRLSDYGKKVADLVLPLWEQGTWEHQIRLILDDKLKDISDYAFRMNGKEHSGLYVNAIGAFGLGVVLDVREVQVNKRVLRKVYSQMMTHADGYDAIIDSAERKLLMFTGGGLKCCT